MILNNKIIQEQRNVSDSQINFSGSLDQRLLKLFDNQSIVIQVYDVIVHCIGMPNVKTGEIVKKVINLTLRFKGWFPNGKGFLLLC